MTQLSDAGEMETVTDIKIDLTKLQRLNESFVVSEIQEEVTFQLGHVDKMAILYRNGNPIKDSPNTRGKRHFIYFCNSSYSSNMLLLTDSETLVSFKRAESYHQI